MSCWEYEVEKVKYKPLQKCLDDAGEEGWELVSAFLFDPREDGTDEVVLIFKRQKPLMVEL